MDIERRGNGVCGIGGILNLDGRPVEPAQLQGMAVLLGKRGPDGAGVFNDGALGLVHTRLSILDPSAAAGQPMSLDDGRYWITFNGEIYNFIELRRELEAAGRRFRTDGDTEVALAAYIQWGEDCQLKFNGMWAFAIWDRQDRRLFLSRDRFGVKPLHYFYDGRTFAFSSVMKGFLPLPAFSARLDPLTAARALVNMNRIEGAQDCIFTGLRRLCGGRRLMLQPGGAPEIRRWWNTLDHLVEPEADPRARREHFRALFFDACRIRMRSDTPLATALSGGLDSSSVLAAVSCLAADRPERAPPEWRSAVIAGFPGADQDETEYALAAAGAAGAESIVLPITAADGLEDIETILFDSEEIYDLVSAPWLLYREMSRRGLKVSLDGHGGDELLAGYDHFITKALNHPEPPLPRAELERTLADLVAPHQQRPSGGWLARNPFLRPPVHDAAFPDVDDDLARLRGTDVVTRALYFDYHYGTLPTILRNFDRASMAHGVEIRAPFMDWRLAAYGFSLPLSDKLHNGCTKYILREAMAGLLPEKVRMRKRKLGFASPLHHWMLGALRPWMLDVVNSRGFLESPVWDGPRVRDVVVGAAAAENGHLMRWGWEFVCAFLVEQSFQQRRTDFF